jgi:hypothetical protein
VTIELGVSVAELGCNGVYILATQERQETPILALSDTHVLKNLEGIL